jgi:hypothetical protein
MDVKGESRVRKTLWLDQPKCTGGAALKLRARLYPAEDLQGISVREVLFPSFRAHIGAFGSTAATNANRQK